FFSYQSIYPSFSTTSSSANYTPSLHDALPISDAQEGAPLRVRREHADAARARGLRGAGRPSVLGERLARRPHRRLRAPSQPVHEDRKSTRLNSSHVKISYAVFCLKKKSDL